MSSKLPLLPSGPGGVRKSTFHGPWRWKLTTISAVVETKHGGAQHGDVRLLGPGDDQFFQTLLETEGPQFFAHLLFKIGVRLAHRTAQHNDFRVVGVKQGHDHLAEIVAKGGKHFLRPAVAVIGANLQGGGVDAEFALEEASTAIIFERLFPVGHRTYLAGAAVIAGIQLAVNDHARAQAGAHNQPDQVAITFAQSEMQFAQRKAVGVVVDEGRHTETPFQDAFDGYRPPGGEVVRHVNDAAFHVHRARHAYADGAHVRLEDGGDGIADFIENEPLFGPGGNGARLQCRNSFVLYQADPDV